MVNKIDYVVICATNNNKNIAKLQKASLYMYHTKKTEIIYGSIKTIVEVWVIKVRKCCQKVIYFKVESTNEPLENDIVRQ